MIGHGYSGREAPDFDLEFEESALPTTGRADRRETASKGSHTVESEANGSPSRLSIPRDIVTKLFHSNQLPNPEIQII